MSVRSIPLQRLLLLATVVLSIAYVLVLRPLVGRVADQTAPVAKLRNRLASATLEAGMGRAPALTDISARLRMLQQASSELNAVAREALPRLEQPPEVRRRLEEPFQYVEFQNESQRRFEELGILASAAGVELAPALAQRFPRYTSNLARPELLWVQLAAVHRLIRTAIECGVSAVNELSLELLPIADWTAPADSPDLQLVRVHLTVNGTVESLLKFLAGLTLTPAELKAAGLPETIGGRPALFIDRILVRRNALEAPESAQLELVVSSAVTSFHL